MSSGRVLSPRSPPTPNVPTTRAGSRRLNAWSSRQAQCRRTSWSNPPRRPVAGSRTRFEKSEQRRPDDCFEPRATASANSAQTAGQDDLRESSRLLARFRIGRKAGTERRTSRSPSRSVGCPILVQVPSPVYADICFWRLSKTSRDLRANPASVRPVPSAVESLCSRCNRAKGNRDTRDFRGPATVDHVESCLFCQKAADADELGSSVLNAIGSRAGNARSRPSAGPNGVGPKSARPSSVGQIGGGARRSAGSGLPTDNPYGKLNRLGVLGGLIW